MKLFITLLTVVVTTGFARAAFFTNSASADSFVRSNAPTLNYGGAGSLSVSGVSATNVSGGTSGASDCFIRFNTTAMVAYFDSLFGSGNWAVNGVKLRVTEQGAPPNAIFNRGIGVIEIRWIANDSWMEGTSTPMTPQTTGIKYNDEPTLLNSSTDASLGTFTNAGMDGTLSFPLALSDAFTADLRVGGEVGFFLIAKDTATGFTFYSRSFTTNSLRPLMEISAAPRPGISTIGLSGANITLSATNGATGEICFALTSTNIVLPLNQWTPVATNILAANGYFTITLTNVLAADGPRQQFFILQTQ